MSVGEMSQAEFSRARSRDPVKGSGEPPSGAWRVRSVLLAGIFALGALPLATTGFAQAVQRWDYWGRGRPFPVYEVAWSKDDALCKTIVKALNHPRPGDNKQLYAYDADRAQYSKLSLYRDPLFLHWKLHPLSKPVGVFPNDDPLRVSAEWMEVPFFNDGQPVAALRFTYPGASDAGQDVYVIPDVEYFKTLTWRMTGELSADPRILRPLKSFQFKRFGEIVEFPKTMKNYEYWNSSSISGEQEFNLARIEKNIYAIVRRPIFEFVLVLFFASRNDGHPLCLIGPTKIIDWRK